MEKKSAQDFIFGRVIGEGEFHHKWKYLEQYFLKKRRKAAIQT
jgi:hypothetical protein